MKPANVFLAGLGCRLPSAFAASEAVAAGLYDPAVFAESALRGVLVAGTEPAPDMAVEAARVALDRSPGGAASIGTVLHASTFYQGPEMWSPSAYIMRELGIRGAGGTEIRNGCNGMLTAVELGAGLLSHQSDDRPDILLTTADNFNSPLINRWDSGPMGVIAADAASSVVLSATGGFARVDAVVSRVYPEFEAMARGDEPLFPPTGSSGRRIDVVGRAQQFNERVKEIDGVSVGDGIAIACTETARAAVGEAGIEVSDLRWVLVPNGDEATTRNCVMEPLGLDVSRSQWEFGCGIGHASASDQFIALDHLLRTGQLAAGDHVLLFGGAPGWSAVAVVLTITELPAWA
ncbi:ketoacyl-ACP synthase III family protein [Streptomyces sp. SL13]|uniref:Ketoacyl-ACP synthase III family protein n=1 Tax=Streptantibioticus silvisoli TaxID=2705255 RepID=A0AA90GUY3_9ACTN|nr:ketoacyl-ACP synthase III family protein [Streptantibioticus silvisoli]MDI5963283.1 ketoacyl-ACP synthase III family protein [Streptantibioticus silvisoli]MDI5968538.1 ketoacyl-ACP synthase III family protein [Streptantibioticus silvisoli]